MKYRKWVLLPVTAVLITLAGIRYHQTLVRILPLYISLLVVLLQSNVNRYASLIGGINALLYGVVYYHYGLYGTMAYTVLFSAPMQFATFILWSRRPYASSTQLRKMTGKQLILTGTVFLLAFVILCLVLSMLGSQYMIFDNTVTLLGILLCILTLLRFREYAWLSVINAVIHFFLYASMIRQFPEQTTYAIYGVYLVICAIITFCNVQKLYQKQQAERITA